MRRLRSSSHEILHAGEHLGRHHDVPRLDLLQKHGILRGVPEAGVEPIQRVPTGRNQRLVPLDEEDLRARRVGVLRRPGHAEGSVGLERQEERLSRPLILVAREGVDGLLISLVEELQRHQALQLVAIGLARLNDQLLGFIDLLIVVEPVRYQANEVSGRDRRVVSIHFDLQGKLLRVLGGRSFLSLSGVQEKLGLGIAVSNDKLNFRPALEHRQVLELLGRLGIERKELWREQGLPGFSQRLGCLHLLRIHCRQILLANELLERADLSHDRGFGICRQHKASSCCVQVLLGLVRLPRALRPHRPSRSDLLQAKLHEFQVDLRLPQRICRGVHRGR
mmetsp:Transcript_16203/g.61764  ORF Transcript_16203/g.61764 Transcript_16203/m.61764 type:complete len:336 (-) Transcript_16203:356-1363(-)